MAWFSLLAGMDAADPSRTRKVCRGGDDCRDFRLFATGPDDNYHMLASRVPIVLAWQYGWLIWISRNALASGSCCVLAFGSAGLSVHTRFDKLIAESQSPKS
jgi:hypothetical protein